MGKLKTYAEAPPGQPTIEQGFASAAAKEPSAAVITSLQAQEDWLKTKNPVEVQQAILDQFQAPSDYELVKNRKRTAITTTMKTRRSNRASSRESDSKKSASPVALKNAAVVSNTQGPRKGWNAEMPSTNVTNVVDLTGFPALPAKSKNSSVSFATTGKTGNVQTKLPWKKVALIFLVDSTPSKKAVPVGQAGPRMRSSCPAGLLTSPPPSSINKRTSQVAPTADDAPNVVTPQKDFFDADHGRNGGKTGGVMPAGLDVTSKSKAAVLLPSKRTVASHPKPSFWPRKPNEIPYTESQLSPVRWSHRTGTGGNNSMHKINYCELFDSETDDDNDMDVEVVDEVLDRHVPSDYIDDPDDDDDNDDDDDGDTDYDDDDAMETQPVATSLMYDDESTDDESLKPAAKPKRGRAKKKSTKPKPATRSRSKQKAQSSSLNPNAGAFVPTANSNGSSSNNTPRKSKHDTVAKPFWKPITGQWCKALPTCEADALNALPDGVRTYNSDFYPHGPLGAVSAFHKEACQPWYPVVSHQVPATGEFAVPLHQIITEREKLDDHKDNDDDDDDDDDEDDDDDDTASDLNVKPAAVEPANKRPRVDPLSTTVVRTHKYRFFPTEEGKQILHVLVECSNRAYNCAVKMYNYTKLTKEEWEHMDEKPMGDATCLRDTGDSEIHSSEALYDNGRINVCALMKLDIGTRASNYAKTAANLSQPQKDARDAKHKQHQKKRAAAVKKREETKLTVTRRSSKKKKPVDAAKKRCSVADQKWTKAFEAYVRDFEFQLFQHGLHPKVFSTYITISNIIFTGKGATHLYNQVRELAQKLIEKDNSAYNLGLAVKISGSKPLLDQCGLQWHEAILQVAKLNTRITEEELAVFLPSSIQNSSAVRVGAISDFMKAWKVKRTTFRPTKEDGTANKTVFFRYRSQKSSNSTIVVPKVTWQNPQDLSCKRFYHKFLHGLCTTPSKPGMVVPPSTNIKRHTTTEKRPEHHYQSKRLGLERNAIQQSKRFNQVLKQREGFEKRRVKRKEQYRKRWARPTKAVVRKRKTRPTKNIKDAKAKPTPKPGELQGRENLPVILQHDSKITIDATGKYYFLHPKDVTVHGMSKAPTSINSTIALDPGVRTFMTGYEADGSCVEWGKYGLDEMIQLMHRKDDIRGELSERRSEGLKAKALHEGRKHRTTTPKKKAPRKPTAEKKPAPAKDKPELTPEQLKAQEKWRLEREAREEARKNNRQRVRNLKAAKRAERANTMGALVKQKQQEEEEEEVVVKNAQLGAEARQKAAESRAKRAERKAKKEQQNIDDANTEEERAALEAARAKKDTAKAIRLEKALLRPTKEERNAKRKQKQTAKAEAMTTTELVPAAPNAADRKRISQGLQQKLCSSFAAISSGA